MCPCQNDELYVPDLGRCPSQQLDSQQIGHGGSSDSAAALRQQLQLQMIDLMLARVSAAKEAIQQGLFPSHQSEPYLKDPWAPAESENMLLHDMESSTFGDVDFAGIDSLFAWWSASRMQAEGSCCDG